MVFVMIVKKQYLESFITVIVGKLASLFKLSFVVGSTGIYLSASSFCMPLVGLFGGISVSTIAWLSMFLLRILCIGSFELSQLAFYIPGYCAALYLAGISSWFRGGLPIACMILFWVHPVGGQAWLYSMYWLIPIVVTVFNMRAFFANTLGATFTAHAVGSVIWLYTVPMPADAWLGLIPQVAIERLTCAAGLVVAYHCVKIIAYGARVVFAPVRGLLFAR
jgi:hypothetical protein